MKYGVDVDATIDPQAISIVVSSLSNTLDNFSRYVKDPKTGKLEDFKFKND